MRKSLFLIILASVFFRSVTFAQTPLPIPVVPQLTWGMTPEQVQQYAPGTMRGQMLVYDTQFLNYAAIGQYYFTDQQLRHATYLPHYTYADAARWQPEFQAIQNYLQTQFGDPNVTQEHYLRWQNAVTQGTLMLTPNGWLTRFDRVPPATGQ